MTPDLVEPKSMRTCTTFPWRLGGQFDAAALEPTTRLVQL
jgi:hypothetical protein